jgi:hypothetical protein
MAFFPFFFLSFLVENEPHPKSSAAASGSGSGKGEATSSIFGASITFAGSSKAFLPFFFLSFLEVPKEPHPKSSAGASGSGSGPGEGVASTCESFRKIPSLYT